MDKLLSYWPLIILVLGAIIMMVAYHPDERNDQ